MEVEARYSITNLPDEILRHILSLLKVTDIARLRVLSKRFKTLCTTTPSFSFFDPHLPFSRDCSCLHVFNFMNTLPQHRPHALKIDQLLFSSFCKRDEHRSFHDKWINTLFRTFHVDELYLYYHLPSIFSSLSGFQSLKVLKLNMRGLVSVKLPEMKLASLETLHMLFIKTEDLVGEWVSQCFLSLKSLFLSHIKVVRHFNITIGSSCLEDLSIKNCCTFRVVRIMCENLRALSYGICFSGQCPHNESVVEICAPNVQSLSWNGASTRLCYDARTFKSLHVAIITQLRFQNFNLLIQLFEAIRWASLLHIDTDTLKDLYGKPSISFGNVRHLEICVERSFYYYKLWLEEEDYDNVGDVLITFLKRISNLETLTLVSEPLDISEEALEECEFKEAVTLCEKTKWKEIKGVKKVKFKIRSMYYSMVLLIGMLKTRCLDLEEMTLNYPSHYDESMNLYLNRLETASSALSINLVSF